MSSTIQDTAKTLFDKGMGVVSDFAASAGDIATKAKIKAQIANQSLEHDTLMRKLGEAIYEEVKQDPRYTDAFPEIFAQIEEVDARKQALEDELARMSAEGDDGEKPLEVNVVSVEDEPKTKDGE